MKERRRRWEHILAKRQSNIDPILVAQNEGLFLGRILLGVGPKTVVQKIGSAIFGAILLLAGIALVTEAILFGDDYGNRLVSFLLNSLAAIFGLVMACAGIQILRNNLIEKTGYER